MMSEDAKTKTGTADLARIIRMIPHRYPFLMIDRVEQIINHVSAVGFKNVTVNEPHFQGHFPAEPVMPGVLIVEAMAQTAGVLVVDSLGKIDQGQLGYFMTINNCRFRQKVTPGDVLELHVNVTRSSGMVYRFAGEAKVNGKVVAEAEFSAMIVGQHDQQRSGSGA